jgi:DNA (cytosine-5)-methyltransferase 1
MAGKSTTESPRLPAISLFSGALGLDLGLEMAGFDTRVAVEMDPFCVETIRLNRPGLPLIPRDIRDVSTKDLLKAAGLHRSEAALVAGGPPCQSFSTAGRRQSIQDPRGSLFREFVRVVEEAQPRFVLMENVRGILSAAIKHRPLAKRGKGHSPLAWRERPGSALKVILSEFDRIGYDVSWKLLNSADYGVPQARERVVFLGSRDGQDLAFPQPTHSRGGLHGLPPWRTLGDGLAGLREKTPEYARFSPSRLKYLRLVPPGGNWRSLPRAQIRAAMGGAFNSGGGKVGFYRRLSWEKWSPTVTASPNQKGTCFCHPDELRPLSVREYMRIQQFPDDWSLAGSTSQKYKQVGNAVPVGLAFAVACEVARAAGGEVPPQWHHARLVQKKLVSASELKTSVSSKRRSSATTASTGASSRGGKLVTLTGLS